MIAIIDYDMGNIRSVENALRRAGAEWTLTADPDTIRRADRVILPGVGHCGEAMARLRERGLTEVICSLRRPVLGICVGMQVMCRHSEEGDTECLGLFDTHVRRLPESPGVKVPDMGWCRLSNTEGRLFDGVARGAYAYFVHSYYAHTCSDTIATSRHGDMLISAALKWENFTGTQFHPEKSGDVGEQIISNFLEL